MTYMEEAKHRAEKLIDAIAKDKAILEGDENPCKQVHRLHEGERLN